MPSDLLWTTSVIWMKMLSREEFSEKRKYLSFSEKIVFVVDEHHEALAAWDQMKPTRLDAINDCNMLHVTLHTPLLILSSYVSHENCDWKEIEHHNLRP
jgi:hypothetical protein